MFSAHDVKSVLFELLPTSCPLKPFWSLSFEPSHQQGPFYPQSHRSLNGFVFLTILCISTDYSNVKILGDL